MYLHKPRRRFKYHSAQRKRLRLFSFHSKNMVV